MIRKRRRNSLRVAFQGEAGAYSEVVAFKFFGESIGTLLCKNLKEVFRAVERKKVKIFGCYCFRKNCKNL